MPSYYLRRYHKNLKQWIYLTTEGEFSQKAMPGIDYDPTWGQWTSEQLKHVNTENYEKVEIKMDKPKYKVGDRVRIVSKPVLSEGLSWEEDMNKCCGKIMTIKHIDPVGHYQMEKNQSKYDWYWSDDMIEGLADTPEDLIAELREEQDHFDDKVNKIRLRSDDTKLSDTQRTLLRASEYLFRVLASVKELQIKDLEQQATKPESAKKYNVLNPDSDDGDQQFFFRTPSHALGTASSANNVDDDQQWTLDQIQEWHLQSFPKFEVESNEARD